jgi:hypothetical protein
MKTSVRDQGIVRIVSVEGDIDLGNSGDLRKILFDALRDSGKLALNLSAIR